MPDAPVADIRVDAASVALLTTVARALLPDAPSGAPVWANDGWDCSMWRWGRDLALRVPRRQTVITAVINEQTWLPRLAPLIERDGVRVPAPVVTGPPTERFPWPWSVVPWFAGAPATQQPRAERTAWATTLADVLASFHRPADRDAPHNPFRGVALAARADDVHANIELLQAHGAATDSDVRTLRGAWADGLRTSPWQRAPVWVHGDLHPGNLIVDGGRLAAVIDFSDLTAGDPAYDLAVAWLAFDADGREVFRRRLSHDAATWTRARAWAAAVAALLLSHSDDSPEYRHLGDDIVREIGAG